MDQRIHVAVNVILMTQICPYVVNSTETFFCILQVQKSVHDLLTS